MNSHLHIFITADKHYLVPALTTMMSLVVANKNQNTIVFHYAWEQSDDGIQKIIIDALSGFTNVDLFFYKLDL